MTRIVHIANTDVEFELARSSLVSLEESWSRHPLCLQLQFLPILYAGPDDLVAVTVLPDADYFATLQHMGWWLGGFPQIVPLEEMSPFQGARCLSWGPSRQVLAWAKARQVDYAIPDWQVVRLVNSKAFSFCYSSLPEAALLYDEQELRSWLHKVKGHKVLKTCFGFSGLGHRHIEDGSPSPELLAFCAKEWRQGRPLVGEPWLDRLWDFSTQWYLHPGGQMEWIGSTRFETDPLGGYRGTLAGPEEILFSSNLSFLQQHKQVARQVLEEVAAIGFFGFVGMDALLYRSSDTGAISLYPVVEINGRQTLSLVALRLQRHFCPQRVMRLRFSREPSSAPSLLPQQLVNIKGTIIHFKHRLTIDYL